MGRKQSDEEAAEFYADPANQAPGIAGGKRSRPALSSHVPVRFRPEIIEQVRIVAERDGVTVSTWIRSVVARAVTARLAQIAPSQTIAALPQKIETQFEGVAPGTMTKPFNEPQVSKAV